MKLYIIRHGETDWNKAHRVQGRSDIPLNEYGRHLAKETAEGMKDIPLDLCYTSPLSRAKETAQIILEGRDVPLIPEEAIEEFCFGEYEGMYIAGEHCDKRLDSFQKFFTDTAHYIPTKGGETVEHLMERTGGFLDRLCRDENLRDKSILISTHGAAMTAMLNYIRGCTREEDFWNREVPFNCAVTTAELENGRLRIVDENHIYYKEAVRHWKVGK